MIAETNFEYDDSKNKYVDMLETGIIDPTRVVRGDFKNAAEIASLLAMANCIIKETII